MSLLLMHERLRNTKGSRRRKEEKVGREKYRLRKGVMRMQMREKEGKGGTFREE